jgi:DNA-directed RNA polymerase subunit beta'
VALSDVLTPKGKKQIIEKYEKLAAKIQSQYDKGLISDVERRRELVEVWSAATKEVNDEMRASFPDDNTINRMVTSGARGNWLQVGNIAGMRGLVSNPRGEVIARPIISSYREGLSVAEYFIATHGARKGLADTALRTADSWLPDSSPRGRGAGCHHSRRRLWHHQGNQLPNCHRERCWRMGPRRERGERRCSPVTWPPTL